MANDTRSSSSSISCIQTLHASSIRNENENANNDDDNEVSLSSFLAQHYGNNSNDNASSSSVAWQCTWSSDGILLASCHGAPHACVRIWRKRRVNNHQSEWYLSSVLSGVHTRTVRSACFAPTFRKSHDSSNDNDEGEENDGTASSVNQYYMLATASFDGTVAIWETLKTTTTHSNSSSNENHETEAKLITEWECTAQLEGHDNEVKCVVFNSTGTLLATCGRDKTVWIWECYSPQNHTTTNRLLTNLDEAENEYECLAVLHGHDADVKSLKFAPSNGQFGDGDDVLLSASYDGTIKCWAEDIDGGDWYCAATLLPQIPLSDRSGGNTPTEEEYGSSTMWSLAITPGGTRIVSGGEDGYITMWQCCTREEHSQRSAPSSSSTYGKKDGTWLCMARICHDQLQNGSDHETLANFSSVYGVDCAPSRAGHGRIAACGGAFDSIVIYREVTSTTATTSGTSTSGNSRGPFVVDALHPKAHAGDVNCICWHPLHGGLLATAGEDGMIKIWQFSLSSR